MFRSLLFVGIPVAFLSATTFAGQSAPGIGAAAVTMTETQASAGSPSNVQELGTQGGRSNGYGKRGGFGFGGPGYCPPPVNICPPVCEPVVQPIVCEKPVIVERPVVVERPVYIDKEVIVERPVFVEKPVYIEKEVIVEKPVYIEKEVIVEKPIFVEKPVICEKPAICEPVAPPVCMKPPICPPSFAFASFHPPFGKFGFQKHHHRRHHHGHGPRHGGPQMARK